MEQIYEEIKYRHQKKLSVPAAIISSIMFSFLIAVFLLMATGNQKTDDQSNENLSAVSNTTENSNASIAASN